MNQINEIGSEACYLTVEISEGRGAVIRRGIVVMCYTRGCAD